MCLSMYLLFYQKFITVFLTKIVNITMNTKELQRLAGILNEDMVTPANMRASEEVKIAQQLLMRSVNLFQQNNSIAGKEYIKKAMMQLETLQARMRNS